MLYEEGKECWDETDSDPFGQIGLIRKSLTFRDATTTHGAIQPFPSSHGSEVDVLK